MAANDYYNGSSMRSPTRSTHSTSGTLSPKSPKSPQFKSLPPDPYTAYTPHHVQPPAPYMSSPYDRQSYDQETSYHPWAEQSHQASPYNAGGIEQEPNPFDDDIPLRQHPSKGGSDAVPSQYSDDPAIVDRRPGNGDRRREEPWYRGKIPWVVYILTTIQITVFIAELSRNGREMELVVGPLRFILVYLSSGIFGFVLGGNFAPEGIASTGASGSLFGIIALMLLDLLYHWGERRSPWADLAWLMFDVVISFVLGLLPGLDNFSHIGGFLMGLILGICLLHSPEPLRRRLSLDEPAYASARRARQAEAGIRGIIRDPIGFFKGRKPLWWVWWLVRATMLVLVFAVFIVLIKNFYKANPTTCHWCRYLSCIDIKNWCDIGQLTTTNQTSPSKRDLFSGPLPINLGDLL
ncbi:hypothetical protein P7C71_g4339, partial [Lecanoromycetidae sp. Uapishka_2]